MGNIRLNSKPSIMGDLPPPIATQVSYAGRTIRMHHIDTSLSYSEQYVSSGVFVDPAGKQNSKLLVKGMVFTFDLDFVDIFKTQDGVLEEARVALQGKEIHTTSKGVVIDIMDDTYAADTIKAWLTWKPEEDLLALCDIYAPLAADFLSQYLGKPQVITYSGTGLHIHYRLDDNDAWTETGVELLPSELRDKALTNIPAMKRLYKLVNKAFKAQYGYSFDDKMSDIGTAITRDIGNLNRKCSANPKTVQDIYTELCNPDARFKLASAVYPEEETSKPKSKRSISERLKDGEGRSFDARVKRTPQILPADETVTFMYAGEETTLTVSDLKEDWSAVKDAGCTVEDATGDKLRVRLDWLSSGSINCFARFNEEQDALVFFCNVDKYINAEDRHVFELDGTLVAVYTYANAIDAQLTRDAKGRVQKTLSNFALIVAGDPRLAGKVKENVRLGQTEIHKDIDLAANPGSPRVRRLSAKREWTYLTDRHIAYISTVIEGYYGVSVAKELVCTAIDTAASSNGYDPVTAWIEGNSWDSVSRLDSWLPRILGLTPKHERYNLYASYGRAALLAIVRNIYSLDTDPVLAQHILMFKGEQNSGKSTLTSVLGATSYIGRDYFSDEEIRIDGKSQDLIQLFRGKFLMEIPELASFNKKDYELIKSFITRSRLEGRLAYDRTWTKQNRATYFVGTTNALVPLGDPTGNRRFLLVDLHNDVKTASGLWNLEGLSTEIPQLYAEAYNRVVLGRDIPADRLTKVYAGDLVEDWNLTPKERDAQDAFNSTFTAVEQTSSAIEGYLESLIDRGITQTTLASLRKSLDEDYNIPRVSNRQVSETLRAKGWRDTRKRGSRVWTYGGEDVPTPPVDVWGERSAKDVAKTNPPVPPSPELSEMLTLMQEMKASLEGLRTENKQLKQDLEEAKATPIDPVIETPVVELPTQVSNIEEIRLLLDTSALIEVLAEEDYKRISKLWLGYQHLPDGNRRTLKGKTLLTRLNNLLGGL
jgi:predicted P-loop ATPase